MRAREMIMRPSIIFSTIAALFLAVPVAVRADYTAVINPNSFVVTNFQGWGTSLCWWANVIGGYPNRTNYADLAFNTLKLNIVRYNIGAGQNPAINYPRQGYRTVMQGFEPTNGVWNWNADTNQRWVLQQAEARGANLVDAFANSPPWWMCVNSNVDGANPPTNNLQINCETNFAMYLATVVSNLTVLDGDHFNYLTPMNEPNGSKWNYTNESQEGCDMTPDQQGRMVNDLYAELKTSAPSVGIDAAEDVDPEQSYIDLTGYLSASLGDVALFTTHTYSFTGASNLKGEANSQKKALWMAEYGDSDGSGLTMARYIYNGIDVMGARAWCYWQVVDSASGWGFLLNSLLATTNASYTPNYTINEKFYVMGQFSEFVRPGCSFVSVNDTNTLAAWNPTNSTLVLVMVNNSGAFNVTYNLNDFTSRPWQVSATQTASGKNMAVLPSPLVVNGQFTEAIPASSVTTFVLTTNVTAPQIVSQSPSSFTNLTLYAGETPGFSVSVLGTVPLYYQWWSNGVAIAGATGAAYKPPGISQGDSASFECVVSNVAGLATNTWSVTVEPGPVTSYPHAALALNPIGFWPLNETQQSAGNDGVVAEDYVGGNNGIYTNVVLGQISYDILTDPSDTSAEFGLAAGVASCVFGISGPDFSLPNGSNAEFAVSAWVNSTGNNGLNTPTIAAKGYYYEEEYALDAGASDCYRFSVRNAAGTAYSANSTISLSSSGQWYHLAGVCDEAHGVVDLYTNGGLAASVPMLTASGITNSSETPMTIGSRATTPSSGFNQQFPGYIADVVIYNYPLSASQIQTLYRAGVTLPPSGLIMTNLTGNAAGLTWNYGVLQTATNIAGPFNDLTNITPPYVVSFTNGQQFFRIREN
jgi:O-glycosyl hydrolase